MVDELKHPSRRGWRHYLDLALMAVVGIVGIAFTANVVVVPIKWAQSQHHVAGLVAAIVALVGVTALLGWTARQKVTSHGFGAHPKLGMAVNLLAVALMASYVFGALSFSLVKLGWARYDLHRAPSSASPDQQLSGAIVDFYAWELVDAVPVLKIWDSFPVKKPVTPADATSRALLFAFRVLILAQALRLLARSVDAKEQLSIAMAYAKLAPDKAERAMEQALAAAEQSGERVYQIDACIELARLRKDAQRWDETQTCLVAARRLIAQEAAYRDLEARRERLAEVGEALGGRNAVP